ncbi:MAG TPA: bifunctional DNA-formamidopyrimidine glycosylase/DNA-(apurinic or apyrimidinic site) lyase [Candidatus Nitrosotalea sp.]|nr:bifunctional DNA-formamidopyrimidine glycosylase/DNA-(apurinic or apyrimidinic site) lyase [Candidatus Nitrosotalea sp.]
MPELPEVETVVCDLRPAVVGRRIERVLHLNPLLLRQREPRPAGELLVGRVIEALERRGKYIIFRCGERLCLIVHLGMTGQLRLVPAGHELAPHVHLRLELQGQQELRLRDPRRFGRVLIGEEEDLIAQGAMPRLGAEPIDPGFDGPLLGRLLSGRRAPIKSLLLDQRIVAGVGNIYADEALFRARIHPARSAAGLGPRRLSRLASALAGALAEGIVHRGSTIADYRDAWGERGHQQDRLQVYGRAGQACLNCGSRLRSIRLGGRTSVFCVRCQR